MAVASGVGAGAEKVIGEHLAEEGDIGAAEMVEWVSGEASDLVEIGLESGLGEGIFAIDELAEEAGERLGDGAREEVSEGEGGFEGAEIVEGAHG